MYYFFKFVSYFQRPDLPKLEGNIQLYEVADEVSDEVLAMIPFPVSDASPTGHHKSGLDILRHLFLGQVTL